MNKENAITAHKNKTGIGKLVKNLFEIIKSKVDKNYILSEKSPKSLKRNKDLIIKTIKRNNKYLNNVSEEILLQELNQKDLPIQGIINIAFENGYILNEESPLVLLGKDGKKAILRYIKIQDKADMFNKNNASFRIKNLLEDLLDKNVFTDLDFQKELFELSIEKGYNISADSPNHLKENEFLASHYYKELIENDIENLNKKNIMNPQLLANKDFLVNYINLLRENGISNEDIIETLTYNEECINAIKNNSNILEFVFENVTPAKLDIFFNKFFDKEEINGFFSSDNITSHKLSRLSQLYKRDETILETLNGNLLDKKYDNIENYKMQIIGKNIHGFQEKLLGLNDFKYNLYSRMSEYVRTKTNRWNRFEQSIVDNLADGYFDDLCQDLYESAKNGDKISQKDIETLTFLLSKQNNSKRAFDEMLKNYYTSESLYSNNTFNITTKKELEYYESIKEIVCDTVLTDSGLEDEKITTPINKYLDKFRALPEIDRVKLALLEKYYNMDLEEARTIVNKFSIDIANLPKDSEYKESIVEQISAIRNIFECIDIDKLKEIGNLDFIVQTDLSTTTYLVEETKELFEEQYKDRLYNPKESEKIGEVEYKGKKIKVFDAGTDISMIVKRVNSNEKNSKDIWNSMTHSKGVGDGNNLRFYTSTSYMTDENLLNEKSSIKGSPEIILGFGQGVNGFSFDEIEICDVGTTFIGGDEVFNNGLYRGGTHMTPDTLESNTKGGYNEIVINTLKTDENGKTNKMQPDYIVYIMEHENYDLEELENNEVWLSSKKAASEFGIPIVVVNKEKIRQSEMNKIADMSEVISYESNDTDLRKFVAKVEHFIERYGDEEVKKLVIMAELSVYKKKLEKTEKEKNKDVSMSNTKQNTPHNRKINDRDSIIKRQEDLRNANVLTGDEGR